MAGTYDVAIESRMQVVVEHWPREEKSARSVSHAEHGGRGGRDLTRRPHNRFVTRTSYRVAVAERETRYKRCNWQRGLCDLYPFPYFGPKAPIPRAVFGTPDRSGFYERSGRLSASPHVPGGWTSPLRGGRGRWFCFRNEMF